DGGVTTKASDATMTGQRMTVFLLPRSQSKAGANPAMPGQVDRIIAEDQVVQGEVVGLLGPNGAGKTTSFYAIVGLVPPDTGRVLYDDEDITSVPMYL